MKIANQHREAIEGIQRDSLVSGCVLIAPNKSDICVHRSDCCDFANLMLQLQDGWQFFALVAWGRNHELGGFGIQKYVTLQGAEGVSSDVLDRALSAFQEVVVADGIWARRGTAGNA